MHGRRYPKEYRQLALLKADERTQEGGSLGGLCKEMGHARSSQYRWKKKEGAEKPGPKGPPPEAIEAMKHEVESLDHVKRRTWGTDAVYEMFSGLIPKHVITETIVNERRRKNKLERDGAIRYEFATPMISWSADFVEVEPGGKVLRLQDDRARFTLGIEHRTGWTSAHVARFSDEAFQRYGFPYFFKHDLGPEFSAGLFQALLRGRKVIALPSPPYYPQANGKNERQNGGLRRWFRPLKSELFSTEETMEELSAAVLDANNDRRMEPLGGRTPRDVFTAERRMELDRSALYVRWDELRQRLFKERYVPGSMEANAAELEAKRIAALAILRQDKLVRYFRGPEAPKV